MKEGSEEIAERKRERERNEFEVGGKILAKKEEKKNAPSGAAYQKHTQLEEKKKKRKFYKIKFPPHISPFFFGRH